VVTPEKKGLSLCARNLWTCKVNPASSCFENLLLNYGLEVSLLHGQALETRAKRFFSPVDLVGRYLRSEITCNCVIQFTWVVSDYAMQGVKMLSKALPPNNKQRWQTRMVTERELLQKLLSFYSYSDLSRSEDFGTIGRLDWWRWCSA
jgi:hypothetical protein